jgi:hypothetical protein
MLECSSLASTKSGIKTHAVDLYNYVVSHGKWFCAQKMTRFELQAVTSIHQTSNE